MQTDEAIRADTLRLFAEKAEQLAARMEHIATAMWAEAEGEAPWTNADLALNLFKLDVASFVDAARPILARRA